MSLPWVSSWGIASGSMVNEYGDTIAQINLGAIPANGWSVDAASSGWGGRVNASGTDRFAEQNSDRGWDNEDSYGGKWSGVETSPTRIFGQWSETPTAGDNVKIMFGAEIGADKIQPTGTYRQEVAFTATTL